MQAPATPNKTQALQKRLTELQKLEKVTPEADRDIYQSRMDDIRRELAQQKQQQQVADSWTEQLRVAERKMRDAS